MAEHIFLSRTRLGSSAMSIASMLLAAIAVLALVLGDSTMAWAAQDTASIAPDIHVDPVTLSAPAGGTIMYKIQIHNDNTASEDLTRVEVTLSYDPNTLTLIDSKLRDQNDFVSKVDHGKATVQFGKIAQGDERSATLIFQVNPAVTTGAPILAETRYHWQATNAEGVGDRQVDNAIAVTTSGPAPAFIAPGAGPAGTIFQIGATQFQSDEHVVTWLNTPTAVQGLQLSGATDAGGDIRLQFDSSGLAPGYYGLVLHGLDSEHEYVLPFIVTPQ